MTKPAISFPRALLDRLFGTEPLGTGVTSGVGPVPSRRIGLAGRHDAATRHLQVAVGVGLLHPFPGVAEPVVAIGLGLEGEPGDLVPPPNERRLARLSRVAPPEVIELDQVRQVLARPAARGDTASTLQKDGVRISDLEHPLIRMIRNLDDPQGKRVEVEEEGCTTHFAAASPSDYSGGKNCPVPRVTTGRSS